jgi:hypothetical protein
MKYFKIADAVAFAGAHGLGGLASAILAKPIHPGVPGKRTRVRKGEFVDLFEREGVLEQFFSRYWPAGNGPEGRNVLNGYRARKALNDELLERGDDGPSVAAIQAEQIDAASEITFGLERDLQAALRANIQQLEDGLVIDDGGKERSCDAGRIDICARDVSGALVVIELKAGVARPGAMTQLLAYIGVVATEEKRPVRGLLIAEDFHPKVLFAARAVQGVRLCRYRFKFAFERVE